MVSAHWSHWTWKLGSWSSAVLDLIIAHWTLAIDHAHERMEQFQFDGGQNEYKYNLTTTSYYRGMHHEQRMRKLPHDQSSDKTRGPLQDGV